MENRAPRRCHGFPGHPRERRGGRGKIQAEPLALSGRGAGTAMVPELARAWRSAQVVGTAPAVGTAHPEGHALSTGSALQAGAAPEDFHRRLVIKAEG